MQRGEIYWLEFGPPVEKMDEETGQPILDAKGEVVLEKKRRPVIVLTRDQLNGGNCVVVVPCYSQDVDRRAKFRQNLVLEQGTGGLPKRCLVRTDQITYIDKRSIDWRQDKIGRLTNEHMKLIVDAVRWAIRDDSL